METFLTCRAVIRHFFETKLLDESAGKFFEELALKAILKALYVSGNFSDIRMLLGDISNILKLNYPVVEDIRVACIKIIPQITDILRLSITQGEYLGLMRDIVELKNILNLLKAFDTYRHK